MSRIACPYCCAIQTFPESNRCKNCENDVPEKYIRAARDTPPVYLAVVGMTAHGKTTFLHSLTYTMDNLGKIARGSFLDALDDDTIDELRIIRGQIETRTKTESTQPRSKEYSLQTPLLFSLKSFMTDDRYPLVIYDLAGESFKDRSEIEQYADPLKLAHTIWFVVSLHDLEHANNEYGSIADLFNIYIAGMERAEANPRGRNLHVIYSKADKLTNQLTNEYHEVLEYIRDDPYASLPDRHPREFRNEQFDEDVYTLDMDRISGQLRDFTEYDVPSGISFVNMVEDYGMNLSFSINTAIGRDHLPNNRMIDYESFRVLDPLIWALRDNAPLGPQAADTVRQDTSAVTLILDTGFSSRSKIYGQHLPSKFFSELSRFGNVNTYYLGTSAPLTRPGYEPTDEYPTRDLVPFIGPILDRLGNKGMVLVVTCQTIRDMRDFHEAQWHERMGVVSFDNPYEVVPRDQWPRNIIFESNKMSDDYIKHIIKKLFEEPI